MPSQNKDQEILQNYGDTLMFPILYMKYLGMNFSEVHEEINLRQDLYVDSCEDIKLRAGMICLCFKQTLWYSHLWAIKLDLYFAPYIKFDICQLSMHT